MKVESQTSAVLESAQKAAAKKGGVGDTSSSRSAVSQEAAFFAEEPEISVEGQAFLKAQKVAQGAPDVREDLVSELKAKIDSGAYEIDPEALADCLVDEHLEVAPWNL